MFTQHTNETKDEELLRIHQPYYHIGTRSATLLCFAITEILAASPRFVFADLENGSSSSFCRSPSHTSDVSLLRPNADRQAHCLEMVSSRSPRHIRCHVQHMSQQNGSIHRSPALVSWFGLLIKNYIIERLSDLQVDSARASSKASI